MPIKSLELYLFERGLVGSYPIEALKNTTLGIDVNHYVSRLLTSKKEQFLDAIGGFPTSLKMYLESDLKIFKEYNITPIFIFDGSMTQNQLTYSGYFTAAAGESLASSTSSSTTGDIASGSSNSGNQTTKTTKESTLFQRHKAWTQWSNLMTSNQNVYIDQPIQPHEPFRYNTMIEAKRYQSDLIAYFIERDITYQVAPFTSWSQLSYLLSNEYIDAIYGPTDCLLLNDVDKFILGMEFPNKDFRFIDKSKVLKEFQCSHDEFVDIAMAVGNDLQPTTLPPLQIYPNNKLFEIALEMVLNTGTNFYAYQLTNYAEDVSVYVEAYQRGVSSLKYMSVLLDTGKVDIYINEIGQSDDLDISNPSSGNGSPERDDSKSSPKSVKPSEIPNDVHEFITQRLPNEYYFYKSLGLVTGKLFDAITTGIYPEETPLDGGSSDSYRELIQKSVDVFKNKELNLLTQPINRYFQMKPIKQVKWFSPNNKVNLLNRTTPSIFDKLNHVIIKTNDQDAQFSVSKFIEVLNNSDDMGKDFISDNVLFPNSVPLEKKLNTSFDLLATDFLRLLIQLEFFNFDATKKTLKPNKWGTILLKFNELGLAPEFQEKFLILLTFIKLDVLSLSDDIKPTVHSALSDHTLRSYPEETKYISVLTRLLTLYQVDQKPTNYHGPIDKKSLIFREHLDFVKENLNEMFESIVVSSLTANEFNKLSLDNVDWQQKIVSKMPFKMGLPNTIMSMMWEFFIQKYLHNGNAKADALTLVATEFNTYKSVSNLDEQFDKSYEYLEQCSKLLEEMGNLKLVLSNEITLVKDSVKFAKTTISSIQN